MTEVKSKTVELVCGTATLTNQVAMHWRRTMKMERQAALPSNVMSQTPSAQNQASAGDGNRHRMQWHSDHR
jgi:hypothetical protein